MNLPGSSTLPIHQLAACFNKTSATYKFYWFLSLLDRAEQGEEVIRKHDLFAEMVAHSWFTVNYFHVSFGKQDKLQQAIEQIKVIENLTIDADRTKIFARLSGSSNKTTIKELHYFNAEVPHRFLSPWFRANDMAMAYQYSQAFTNNCPYAVYKDHIRINPAWKGYLIRNAGILKAFCYWNLAVYLQSKNPNVPDIPNKLIKVPVRKNLTEQRKFWDIIINELGSVDCIYTNTKLKTGDYAVEHFVPYAFVSHDLIWNLIPADRSFNSSKTDKLPLLDLHFDPFFKLQQQAVEIMQWKYPQQKFLQEYLTLFPELTPSYFTKDKFLEQIKPLITIASNNGFEYMANNYGLS
jgi:hypothetical protein